MTRKETDKEFQERVLREAPVYTPADPDNLNLTEDICRYPQVYWDASECNKVVRRRGSDGYGNTHPYPGQVQDSSAAVKQYGLQLFNGGTIIEGTWFKGYFRPFPRLHKDYEYCYITEWGVYLRKKQKETNV